MKIVKWLAALFVLCLAGSGSVWADRGHHDHGRHGGNIRFGVVVGPYWGPWFYPPAPYYYPPYYPPVVVQRPAPTVYIEQPAAPAPQTNYWYYCNASRAYYPYVKECPGGWQRVLPQPLEQP